jgi:hypothetical protein
MDGRADLRDAVKRNLVADVARSFGQVRLKVTGTSMLPSVYPGDILTVQRCHAADLNPGQIILGFRNEALVAHRLVRKEKNQFLTRGDSLYNYDHPFQVEEILGRVVSIDRDGREISIVPAWWHSAVRFLLRRSQLLIRVLLNVVGMVESRMRMPVKAAGENR